MLPCSTSWRWRASPPGRSRRSAPRREARGAEHRLVIVAPDGRQSSGGKARQSAWQRLLIRRDCAWRWFPIKSSPSSREGSGDMERKLQEGDAARQQPAAGCSFAIGATGPTVRWIRATGGVGVIVPSCSDVLRDRRVHAGAGCQPRWRPSETRSCTIRSMRFEVLGGSDQGHGDHRGARCPEHSALHDRQLRIHRRGGFPLRSPCAPRNVQARKVPVCRGRGADQPDPVRLQADRSHAVICGRAWVRVQQLGCEWRNGGLL
jgi:hypothetical protein